MPQPPDPTDRDLGLAAPITRKDFLNGVLLGAGALLLGAAPPARALAAAGARRAPDPTAALRAPDPWTGYGGEGDYASANGDTRAAVEAAQRVRDGVHVPLPAGAVDTGETYDLVVVGGGIAGLTAALTFARETGGARRCLVLEGAAMPGGHARRNEFLVDGVHLVAPQGSDAVAIPDPDDAAGDVWDAVGLPRAVAAQAPAGAAAGLRLPPDHTAPLDGVHESALDVAYYFDERSGAKRPTWLRNVWRDDLAGTPFPARLRRDLVRWRTTSGQDGDATRRHLDTLSYAHFLEQELDLDPGVTAAITPVVGLLAGASPDAVSALAAAQAGLPGVARVRPPTAPLPPSLPGGNAAIARHLLKRLVPEAIAGPSTAGGIHEGGVRLAALDRAGQPTRLRLGATAVRVEHAARGGSAQRMLVAYEQGGRVHTVRARAVVLAGSGALNAHVADLPDDLRRAYGTFVHAPALVVNVALTNWRFLQRLEAGAVRWFDGEFGFTAALRRPARIGTRPAPLDPDRPAVLSLHVGFPAPGVPLAEQVEAGRAALLASSYADYERRVRHQLVRLFADQGFDPRRDVAGVVLNRWLHGRLVQPPGFHYGDGESPPPRAIVAEGYGRVAIAHAELDGHQTALGAMRQGVRAARQALAMR